MARGVASCTYRLQRAVSRSRFAGSLRSSGRLRSGTRGAVGAAELPIPEPKQLPVTDGCKLLMFNLESTWNSTFKPRGLKKVLVDNFHDFSSQNRSKLMLTNPLRGC